MATRRIEINPDEEVIIVIAGATIEVGLADPDFCGNAEHIVNVRIEPTTGSKLTVYEDSRNVDIEVESGVRKAAWERLKQALPQNAAISTQN
ncbi:MAG: hypothetical protein ACXWQ5_00045 [Ktedonobacterales bacterium]